MTTSDSKIIMDTIVEIKTHARHGSAVKKAFDEMERIDKKFSAHKEGSEVFRINSSKSEEIKVDGETRDLILFSIGISSISEGVFDLTIFPLVKLWDIKEQNKIPTNDEIKYKLRNTGYRKISLADGTLLKDSCVRIDLGGFAKGYAVDKAVETLKKNGVKTGIVNAGGDIRAFGNKYWKIGIQHPRKKDGLLGILTLKNKSIVTSGDYERFFIKNGKRYHHIINPKTGYPADELMSVSVISDSCMLADALATAVFVLGTKHGLKLIENQKNAECIVVDNGGKIFTSKGLKNKNLRF